MGLRKSSGFLEFKQLQLHDFEQFHKMIEKGTIVCPTLGHHHLFLSGFFSVRTITNLQRLRWLN